MSELITNDARLGARLAADQLAPHMTQRLLDGEKPLAVADWLQQDLLAYTEVDRQELAQALQLHFVRTVPLADRLALAGKDRSAVAKTVARQRSGESTLAKLRTLTDLQLGRVALAHEIEANLGVPMGSVANEIEIARRLLRDQHGMEQEVGDTSVVANQSNTLRARLGKIMLNLLEQDQREQLEPVEVEVTVSE